MSLKPFQTHSGIAAPLLQDNIDTDQIIPSREMKTVSKTGLADGLFAGQRYAAPGTRDENPEFILNQKDYRGASILLTGKNFGCGSSREHAVWALAEYGVRVIIAESFGEIFYNNCLNNGVLPIKLSKDIIAQMEGRLTIDLPLQVIEFEGIAYSFDIPPSEKRRLVDGLDMISLTLLERDKINTFFKTDKAQRPWV